MQLLRWEYALVHADRVYAAEGRPRRERNIVFDWAPVDGSSALVRCKEQTIGSKLMTARSPVG